MLGRNAATGFVHQAKYDTAVVLEFIGQLNPEVGESGNGHLRASNQTAIKLRITTRQNFVVGRGGRVVLGGSMEGRTESKDILVGIKESVGLFFNSDVIDNRRKFRQVGRSEG